MPRAPVLRNTCHGPRTPIPQRAGCLPHCYFSEGSRDANDAITDISYIEPWHCENCGGLPRHMHTRPQAAKRARVSFGPDLAVVTEPPITKGGLATGHQGGGWGGHWPTRTEMPQQTTGKGNLKAAMEPPITKSKRTLEALSSASFALQAVQIPDHKRHAGARHTGSSHKTPGDESDAADAATIRDRFSLRRTIDSMEGGTCGSSQSAARP